MCQEEKKPYYVQVYHKDIRLKFRTLNRLLLAALGRIFSVFRFLPSAAPARLPEFRASYQIPVLPYLSWGMASWWQRGKSKTQSFSDLPQAVFWCRLEISLGAWISEAWCASSIFSDLEPSRENQRTLTDIWVVRVLGLSADSSAYKFHGHPTNFLLGVWGAGNTYPKSTWKNLSKRAFLKIFITWVGFGGTLAAWNQIFFIDPCNLPGLRKEIKSAVRTVTKAYEKLSCRAARACRDAYRERCRIVGKRNPIKKRNLRAKIRSYTVPLLSGAFMIILNSHLF